MISQIILKNKEDFIKFNKINEEAKEYMKQKIDPYKNHPIIVLIGMLGVGKSSLTCSLLNKSLIVQAIGKRTQLIGDGVGLGLEACTTVPSIAFNFREKLLLVDFPGFEDNRNYEQEIFNSIAIDSLFEILQSYKKQYKIVLVITSHDFKTNRCSKVIDSFSRLKKIFPKYDEIKQTFALVITKGDNEYEANDYIDYFNEMISQTTYQTTDMKSVHQFLNRFKNNIFVFPEPLKENIGKQYDFKDHMSLINFLKTNYLCNIEHRITISENAESNLILSYGNHKKNVVDSIYKICQKINNQYKYETSSVNIKNWIDYIENIKNIKIETINDFKNVIKQNIPFSNSYNRDLNNLSDFILFDDLIMKVLPSQLDKKYIDDYIKSWCNECIHDLTQKYKKAKDDEEIEHQKRIMKQEMERKKRKEEELERKKREQIESEKRHKAMLDECKRKEEESRRELAKIQEQILSLRVYGG